MSKCVIHDATLRCRSEGTRLYRKQKMRHGGLIFGPIECPAGRGLLAEGRKHHADRGLRGRARILWQKRELRIAYAADGGRRIGASTAPFWWSRSRGSLSSICEIPRFFLIWTKNYRTTVVCVSSRKPFSSRFDPAVCNSHFAIHTRNGQ